MTSTTPASRLRRGRHLGTALSLLVLAVGGLGGCASGAGDLAPVTVTVTPSDLPAQALAAPTPVPTEPATPTASSTTLPRQLSAGPATGAPTSYADALARLGQAALDPKVSGVFTSPTGNIFCTVARDALVKGCEVAEGRVAPPKPMTCPSPGAKDVGRVEWQPSGPVPTCNSDTIRVQGAPKLAYGTTSDVAGSAYACLSESVGVTCIDRDLGRGFFIARGSFTLF